MSFLARTLRRLNPVREFNVRRTSSLRSHPSVYQVDDVIFFDNEGSGGFGASAAVSAVEGLTILGYQKIIENDIVYGKITTDGNHELYVGDEVIVTSTVIPDNTNKTYYTKVVSGIEDIVIDQEGVGSE